jgi:hypothetical protein
MKSLIILAAAGLVGTAGGLLMAEVDKAPARAEQRAAQEAAEQSVYYEGCDEVRLLGKAPLYRGQPGYGTHMDGDNDGIACEPHY